MDNAWVVPIVLLIFVYASVGALLGLLWVITRLAYRPAHKYWRLPPKTWSILLAGLVTQVISILIFTGAVYVSFLPPPFTPLYDVLFVLGCAGVSLSSLILVLWLALVIRAKRHIPPLEALFGQDRKRRKWVIISIALCPLLVFGQIAGPDHFHSWPLGVFVTVPFTLYMLCIASLIAHSSEEPVAKTS